MSLWQAGRVLSYLRMALDWRRAGPVYLVVFVKGTSHAKCVHCFLPSLSEHHTGGEELTPQEFEKLSRRLGPDIYSILLAGGEPFQRKDLGQVLEILSDNQHVRVLKVVTNGFFTERTVSTWEYILRLRTNKYYGVTISLDGLEQVHDEIRGIKGMFVKAVDTFEKLRLLARTHPNFEVDISVTISRYNQDHIEPLYHYLRDTLGVENVNCTVTRGEPRKPLARDVNLEKYLGFKDLLKADLTGGRLRGIARFDRPDAANAVNLTQRDRIGDMLRTGRFISRCNAGRLSAVIGSDAKVYPCELLNTPIGDLRESDYDLLKIWHSQVARRLRREIVATDCHCTYENANLVNILFSPRYYAEVLGNLLRIKLGRHWPVRRPAGARLPLPVVSQAAGVGSPSGA